MSGVTSSPAQQEKGHFESLPPLTSGAFATLNAGDKLSLLLLTYTDEGAPIMYRVGYVHHELTYRSPGQKDAVAFGKARFNFEFDYLEELKDVRILFSQPHASATLRGLALEGKVKLGRPYDG